MMFIIEGFPTIIFIFIVFFHNVATTPGQSEPGSDGNQMVLCIPQRSIITGASPSDCLVSYLGHTLGESNSSPEMQLMYSATPANWAKYPWGRYDHFYLPCYELL